MSFQTLRISLGLSLSLSLSLSLGRFRWYRKTMDAASNLLPLRHQLQTSSGARCSTITYYTRVLHGIPNIFEPSPTSFKPRCKCRGRRFLNLTRATYKRVVSESCARSETLNLINGVVVDSEIGEGPEQIPQGGGGEETLFSAQQTSSCDPSALSDGLRNRIPFHP